MSLSAADFSDGSAITVTADHPFWVDAGTLLSAPGWIEVGNLRPGDVLRTATGPGVVVEGLRRGAASPCHYDNIVVSIADVTRRADRRLAAQGLADPCRATLPVAA